MSLYQIIAHLIRQPGRASHELPRGLWLVFYSPTGDEPCRLIAARHLAEPSQRELTTVADHLLDVLDGVETRVATDITPWAEVNNNDWHGYAITWRALSVNDAFSPDPDRAAHIRRALERRDERIAERRQKEQSRWPRRSAANPGSKPML